MTGVELRIAVTEEDHHRGPLNAPIMLVEYGDFECPYCGAAYRPIEKFIEAQQDNVCFVFRNFPLANVHPYAAIAALAAEAAGMQNKYWEMHHMIYENQSLLSEIGRAHV